MNQMLEVLALPISWVSDTLCACAAVSPGVTALAVRAAVPRL